MGTSAPTEPREQAVPPASLATKIQAAEEGGWQREPLGGSLTVSLKPHLLAFPIGEGVPRSRDEGDRREQCDGGVVHGKERPGAGDKLKLQETGGQDEQVAEG